MGLKDLNENSHFEGTVEIVQKIRTKSGITVLHVTDYMGSMDAVCSDCSYNVGEVVDISGKAEQKYGKLQISLESVKLSDKTKEELVSDLVSPKVTEPYAKTEAMITMNARMLEIARRIRKAVFDGEPILIRHHADTDGITGAIALELACRNLIGTRGNNPDYHLYRFPTRIPYYDTSDAFRDISFAKKLMESRGHNKPLIISIDNGSSDEETLSLKLVKLFGFELLIIDHHSPGAVVDGRSKACEHASLHLNPYLFGYDQSITAGMLGFEISRMVDDSTEMRILPALAAVADKSSSQEAESYIKESGKSRDELQDLARVIDFCAFNLSHDASTGTYLEVISNDSLSQGIHNEIIELVQKAEVLAGKSLAVEEGKVCLAHYDVPDTSYPTAGMLTGIINQKLSKEKIRLMTLGFAGSLMVFRANNDITRLHDFMAFIRDKHKDSLISGGGHEMAGSIRFGGITKEDILNTAREFISGKEVA